MAKMNSAFKYFLDAEAAVTMRAESAASITSTTSETAVSLNELNAAYWDNDELPYETLAVVISVTTIDFTTTDETYVFTVESGEDLAVTTPVVQATLPDIGALGAGFYTVLLDVDTLKKLDPDASHLRITATLGGTTPILDYAAFLSPIVTAHAS